MWTKSFLRQEIDDDYPGVVVVLSDRRRVIEANGLWVVQRRIVSRNPRETGRWWTGRSYCRSREALLRICGHHPDLMALPEGVVYPVLKYGRYTKLASATSQKD
jgi:hypothetical protein